MTTRQKEPYTPQKAYRRRLMKRGLVAVTDWVPFNDKPKLLKYAAKLRKDAGISKRQDGS